MYLPKVNLQRIQSLIIQSEERKNILAPHFNGKLFLLQNAPVFNLEMLQKATPRVHQLLFSGTAFERFGVMHCIDFIQTHPNYHLTIIGKVPDLENALIHKKYSQLINEKRLLIEKTYFSTNELIVEMGKYRIGFCFYDFSFPEIDNDNYKTAPSGKMFAYFAAGVPIIGIKIPGLLPIATFNAGVLIDELTTNAIEIALQEIEANYSEMVDGCFKAAMHFSFDNAMQPIASFLSDHQ
jgi:glycosyltransferase involved in cell wall biosynthesis